MIFVNVASLDCIFYSMKLDHSVWIVDSYNKSIPILYAFFFLISIVFPAGSAKIYIPQRISATLCLHPCHHLLLSVFRILAIPTGTRRHLILIFVSVSPTLNEITHVVVHLPLAFFFFVFWELVYVISLGSHLKNSLTSSRRNV